MIIQQLSLYPARRDFRIWQHTAEAIHLYS